jgi:hypothetical protein
VGCPPHAPTRLREAQDAGLVDPAADVEETATMAAWAIERTVARSVQTRGPDHDDRLARALARGLWLMTFGDGPGGG